MMYLLVVDGDADTRVKIGREARKKGFGVDEAENGVQAMKLFRRREYDMVLMDAELSELDGLTVCRQMRKSSTVPVVFLTGKSNEYDRLAAFECGADDYMLKPFYVSELFARIQAILRRRRTQDKRSVLTADGVSVDTDSRTVYVDDTQAALAPREYDLLVYLLQNSNVALSREIILDHVWGEDFEGADRTVDTHVKALRKRLHPYGKNIVTVWGYGYKMEK